MVVDVVSFNCTNILGRAGLTIRGPHTNVRRGPFSHTSSQDFLWTCTFFSGGALFFPKKVDDLFSRRYYAEHSNVKTARSKFDYTLSIVLQKRQSLGYTTLALTHFFVDICNCCHTNKKQKNELVDLRSCINQRVKHAIVAAAGGTEA